MFRRYTPDGCMQSDWLTEENDPAQGEPLLELVMKNGRRIAPPESLAVVRERAAADLARLPDRLRTLAPADPPYPVEVAPRLQNLAHQVDAITAT